MPRTHFAQFELAGGRPVEVEYSATGGEPNYDHPGHICDGGGSGPEIVVVDCWPNDLAYHSLAQKWAATLSRRRTIWSRFLRWTIEVRMTWASWRRASLTTEEREGIEAALAEKYEEPDDDLEYDYDPRGA